MTVTSFASSFLSRIFFSCLLLTIWKMLWKRKVETGMARLRKIANSSTQPMLIIRNLWTSNSRFIILKVEDLFLNENFVSNFGWLVLETWWIWLSLKLEILNRIWRLMTFASKWIIMCQNETNLICHLSTFHSTQPGTDNCNVDLFRATGSKHALSIAQHSGRGGHGPLARRAAHRHYRVHLKLVWLGPDLNGPTRKLFCQLGLINQIHNTSATIWPENCQPTENTK